MTPNRGSCSTTEVVTVQANKGHGLTQIALFSALPPSVVAHMETFSSLEQACGGTVLFSEGEEAKAFFGLLSGRIKIYKLSPSGEEHILHMQQPGDLVAEGAIFDSEVYPAFGEVVEDASFVRISRKGFLDLLAGQPTVALKLMAAYSKRLRGFVDAIEDLTLRNLRARLAKYLLTHAKIENNRHVVVLPMAKKELAALLGTIPETLSRALSHFKKEGLLEETDKVLTVLSPQQLQMYISDIVA